MFLTGIEDQNNPRLQLRLFPRVSFVVGLTATERIRLIDQLVGDYGTHDEQLVVSVATESPETSTEPFGSADATLDELVARRLGLTQALPNVLSVTDLPGMDPSVGEYKAACKAQEAAQREFDEAERLLGVIQDRGPRSPLEIETATACAQYAQDRAQRLDEWLSELSDQQIGEDPFAEEEARLIALETSIQRRIDELQVLLGPQAAFAQTIQTLLDEIAQSPTREERRFEIERIDELGLRYEALARTNARLIGRPRPPHWIIAQTRGEYEDAKGRVDALEYQAGQGIDVSKPLVRAKERLVEAEAAWNELRHGVEAEYQALDEQCASFLFDVEAELGEPTTMETVAKQLIARREQLWSAEDPRVTLGREISRQGIIVTYDNVVDVAAHWIDAHVDPSCSYDMAQQELATALVDRDDVRRQRDELDFQRGVVRDESLDNDVLERGFGDHSDETLARIHEALLHVAEARHQEREWRALLDEVQQDRREAFDEFANDVSARERYDKAVTALDAAALRRQRAATSLADAGVDSDAPVNMTSITEAVLQHGARLRMPNAHRGLPLIIDGAFAVLEPNLQREVFVLIERMSSLMQIIYLAAHDELDAFSQVPCTTRSGVVEVGAMTSSDSLVE